MNKINLTVTRGDTPVLSADVLYIGDNGRVFCGRIRCAGATAHFSGCDLSGQKVDRLPPGTDFKCESCR
jgi:hypothetical protein